MSDLVDSAADASPPTTANRRGFIASALTLLSGAMIAQAVNLLSIPALTRCYSPTDFAAFALMAAIVTVVMSFATGRYEFALMICDEDEDRARILSLGFLLATLTATCVGLLGLAIWTLQIAWLPIPLSWVALAPALLLVCGCASVCNQFQIATGKFPRVASAEVSMVLIVAASQLSLAYFGETSGTQLIAGMLIGRAAALLIVARDVPQFIYRQRGTINGHRLWQTAKAFKRFPTCTTLFELVAAGSNEMPAFVLRLCFAPQALGFFALSMRVLEKPVQLINTSIAPVVLRRVAQIRHDNAAVNRLLFQMSGCLFVLILPAVGVLLFFSEPLFEFAFGAEWASAGKYACLLTPLLAVRFATLPSWTGLIGRGKPQLMLVWTVIHFVVTSLAMLLVIPAGSPEAVVLAFSIAGALTHLLLLALNLKVSDDRPASSSEASPSNPAAAAGSTSASPTASPLAA